MIKINLLPFRAARKKENIRRQISIYLLMVVFVLVVTGYFFLKLNGDIKRLETEKTQKQKELAAYAQTTKKIKALRIKIGQIKSGASFGRNSHGSAQRPGVAYFTIRKRRCFDPEGYCQGQ